MKLRLIITVLLCLMGNITHHALTHADPDVPSLDVADCEKHVRIYREDIQSYQRRYNTMILMGASSISAHRTMSYEWAQINGHKSTKK